MNQRKKLLKENEKVLTFIKNWQIKNEYFPQYLNQYNKKFQKEFSAFLDAGNFSKETILIFKS